MLERLLKAIQNGDIAQMTAVLKEIPELALSAYAVCEAGRAAFQQALVELHRQGADLNALYRGYRPIQSLIQEKPQKGDRAATRPRILCLKWMLAHGADPEQLAAFPPARAVLIAAFTGEEKYVETLLTAGAIVDGFVHAALGDVDGVVKALAKDASFATARDRGGLTALQCAACSRMGRDDPAAAKRQLAIAQLLVDNGADLNAETKGWNNQLAVSHFVVAGGNKGIFELLLQRGMSATGSLSATVRKGLHDWTELAVVHGAKLDEARDEGQPLLHQMIRGGQVEQALWLLGKGADPNLTGERGWTPLHQAASRGNARVIKALLEAGADPRRKTNDGELPQALTRRVDLRKLFPRQ